MGILGGFFVIGFLLYDIHFTVGKHSYADFRYTKEKTHSLYLDPFARSTQDDSCKLCFGPEDCLVIEDSWCGYYLETSKALGEDAAASAEETTNAKLKNEVDDIMFNTMKKASVDDEFEECIPFVSEYTNCNKDNICTGCQRCTCDAHGMWSCAPVQQCRPSQRTLDVDHRVLLLAMKALAGLPHGDRITFKYFDGNRVKRSNLELTDQEIIYKKIADWMNDVKPRNLRDIVVKPENKILKSMMENIFDEMKRNMSGNYDADSDTFTFDDLLRNMEDYNPAVKRDEVKASIARNMEPSPVTTLTDQVIQLDNSTDEDIYNYFMFLDDRMSTEGSLDIMAQGDSIHSVVMKREVFNANNDTVTNGNKGEKNDTAINVDGFTTNSIITSETSATTEIITRANESDININSTTESFQSLNDKVLVPIDSIISSKQNEIDELQRIRDDVMKYAKDKQLNITTNRTRNLENNTHFALYKLEIFPSLPSAIMRTDHMTLKGSIDSMKRDLIRVLRDVAVLRKLLKGNDIPKDLKYLVSAIRYYIQEQARRDQVKLQQSAFYSGNTETNAIKDISTYTGEYSSDTNYVKDGLMKILRVIDIEMPQSKAFSPLSQDTKKTMKRVINVLVSNEIVNSQKHFKINVIKELRDIDNKLSKLMDNFNACKINNRLHKLKQTHLEVSVIINKLSDILAITDVYRSRKMHVDVKEAKTIARNINKQLEHIITNIDRLFLLFREGSRKKKVNFELTTVNIEVHKKTSLLNRLKSIMKNFVHKKKQVNNTEEKNSDMVEKYMNEYENAIKNWPLTVKPRHEINKRSPGERVRKLKNRIQNIIPKYLRKKVHPVMVKKSIAKQKKTQKLHKRNAVPLMYDISTSNESTRRKSGMHRAEHKPVIHPVNITAATTSKRPTHYIPKYIMNKLGSTEINGKGYEFYEMKKNPNLFYSETMKDETPRKSKYRKKKLTFTGPTTSTMKSTKANSLHHSKVRHKKTDFIDEMWQGISNFFG